MCDLYNKYQMTQTLKWTKACKSAIDNQILKKKSYNSLKIYLMNVQNWNGNLKIFINIF